MGVERARLRADLERLTAGRKDAPLVFFCLSSECWMSYNAGFETRKAEPHRR
jgi:hypothetical protein